MTSEPSTPSVGNEAPLGHSITSHHALGFGFCCKDKDALDEAMAWRLWAMQQPDLEAEVRRQQEGPRTVK